MDYRIEPATPADAAAISAVRRKAFRQVAEYLNRTDLPMLYQSEAEIAEECHASVILKCVENRTIIGTVQGFADQDNFCRIGKLAVDPDCQNRGIARALIAEIETRFAACRRYCLFTSEDTPWTVALYRKLGYREIGHGPVGTMTMVFMEKLSL